MIKDFLTAVSKPAKYGELIKNRGGRVFGYVALLVLVCSIGLIIIPTLSMGSRTAKILWEDIPQFTITESGMKINDTFELELGGVKILATNKSQVAESDFGDNISGVLLDADSVIIRNFNATQEFLYSEFGKKFVFTKQNLAELLPAMYISFALMYLMLYISYGISYFLNGLFVGAVASLISIFMGIKMKTGKYITLGMYAISLPYAVSAVLLPFGLNMPDVVLYGVGIVMVVLYYREIRSVSPEHEDN